MSVRSFALVPALVALVACKTTTTTTYNGCTVDAALDTDAATPGDEITATGTPFTEAFDTRVLVAGVDAPVTDLTRDGCDLCDACVADQTCDPCGECDACATSCESCVQTVTFTVPPVSSGPQSVVIVNSYGATSPMTLTITGGVDTDTDTGGVDTDTDTDTGAVDTDTDTGAVDTDTDTGAVDTDTAGGTGSTPFRSRRPGAHRIPLYSDLPGVCLLPR